MSWILFGLPYPGAIGKQNPQIDELSVMAIGDFANMTKTSDTEYKHTNTHFSVTIYLIVSLHPEVFRSKRKGQRTDADVPMSTMGPGMSSPRSARPQYAVSPAMYHQPVSI